MATPQNVASAVAAFAANDREKQLRSVFGSKSRERSLDIPGRSHVGNIPYEATEEQLKDIFSEVGPVVTFRLVFDRETGKPKGYGFCEYKDQETALSAMRNLNAYELNGRTLRVDNAASERSKEELKILQEQESQMKQPLIEPERAPEAISKAVASLPPEQMFELMKQMQACIQNNPTQAREILLQNAQLAYALLQAQVVMRIVSPETAVSMLQKPNKSANITAPQENNSPHPAPVIPPIPIVPSSQQQVSGPSMSLSSMPSSNPTPRPLMSNAPIPHSMPLPQNTTFPIVSGNSSHGAPTHDNYDQRNSMGDRDMRMPPVVRGDPRSMPNDSKFDPRIRNEPQNRGPMSNQYNPRLSVPMGGGNQSSYHGNVSGDPRIMQGNPPPNMNRSAPNPMPRMPVNQGIAQGIMPQPRIGAPASQLITSQDQEKAALIMQVLQLSQEQIACLPEEQKQSIMVLKDQIARSQQH
ncbi:Cleavage stimulation factor subunit 2 [Nymphon striatum]|nr:Cleavage stimulation factor subunit 2 [Nymphon striatum]